ncbi:Donson [Corchorus capsularis]|uniref:Donson n=1 Tax=Corchorus capsularis TaxID=210143 RepID=A0A1R3ITZ5_COCAP|nr:Donson [Corchorus capsularis]
MFLLSFVIESPHSSDLEETLVPATQFEPQPPAPPSADVSKKRKHHRDGNTQLNTHLKKCKMMPRFYMKFTDFYEFENSSIEQPCSLRKISTLSDLAAKRRQQLSCPEASVDVPKDYEAHARRTLEKCSQGTFLSVTELSSGGQKASGLAAIDMDKALKGFAARESTPNVPPESSGKFDDLSPTGNFCSEFHVTGQKIPVDFTLKTYMRLVSSSSVNWLNRAMMCGTYNGMPQLKSQSCWSGNQNISSASQTRFASQVLDFKALHSWIYPQSTLPPSIVSVLASSACEDEMDFVRNRQGAWEDSFRSLYYMFRENACSIFYVLRSNDVYLEHVGNIFHDVSFSMPLCRSQIEHVTTEDLVELSEIEKHNLGQTRRKNSFSDVDNTPQCLLAFSGIDNVHVDVPILYSPVPFQNAALSALKVRCREIKMADHGAAPPKGSTLKDGDFKALSSNGLCYCLEIKDSYIPPWIISNICALMASEGRSFEASFTTELASVGLNIALEAVSEEADNEAIVGEEPKEIVCEEVDSEATVGEEPEEISDAFGIPEAIGSPHMLSGLLKGLNYCNGSYTVSLSPV